MEAEGGDGKERDVLIYQLRLGPTSVNFGNDGRNTCPGLPFFGSYIT